MPPHVLHASPSRAKRGPKAPLWEWGPPAETGQESPLRSPARSNPYSTTSAGTGSSRHDHSPRMRANPTPRQHPQTRPRLRHHPQRSPGQARREHRRQQPRRLRTLHARQSDPVPDVPAGEHRRPPARENINTRYTACVRLYVIPGLGKKEPTDSLLTACGNRRASRCPACSRVYAADTFQLIRAGLTGGKSVPDTVRTHPRVFVTLTAPSFGPVHNRPTDAGGVLRPCRCGKCHEPMNALLGTPLDPKSYDYPCAVLFNAHAGALWARFTIYLRCEIAARLGLIQTAARGAARVLRQGRRVPEARPGPLLRRDPPRRPGRQHSAPAPVRHCHHARRRHPGRRRPRLGQRRLGCGRGTRTRLG